MEAETTHKRRVRYKGTHPRTFEEKYKEHDPEKYADTVAKEYGPFDFMLSMVCRFPRGLSSKRRKTAIIRIRFTSCPRSNTIQSHRIFIPVIPIFSRRIVRV